MTKREERYSLTPLGAMMDASAYDERQARAVMDKMELYARRCGLGAGEGTYPAIVMVGEGWEFTEVEAQGEHHEQD